jgi:hypothetical protein
MQEKHEQPESGETKFSPLGEHGAIPGAPNGPPLPDSPPPTAVCPQPTALPPAFFPIRDLPKIAHEDADWIWDGYLARGAVTLLVSEPKAGKSTLVFGLMQKLLAGQPFLGRMCGTGRAVSAREVECGTGRAASARVAGTADLHQPGSPEVEAGRPSASNSSENEQLTSDDTGRNGPARATPPRGAIYFSEEPLSTLREKAERFELTAHGERIQLVSRRQSANRRIDLSTALDKAVEKAHAIGAGLIVIDTLSAWSGLKAEEENSASACEALMAQFRNAAAESDTSVLVIHHTRKDKAIVRGSTVLTGSADVILLLERDVFEPRHSKPRNQNAKLSVASRFSNAPDPLHFVLNAEGYTVVGAKQDAIDKHAIVYELLPKAPPGITRKELCERTGMSRWQLYCRLRELLAAGAVVSVDADLANVPERLHRCTE